MGRRRKYNTPYEVKHQIDLYFAECAEKDVFPDEAGMRLFLKLSKRTIQRMVDDEDTIYTPAEHMEYQRIFDEAKDKRQSYLERRMVAEPKLAQGCMNSLKQPANGGFKDRYEADIDTKLTINVVGVGGENAFK